MLVIASTLFFSASAFSTVVENLTYTKTQAATLQDMLNKLQTRHFREMRVDDSLSNHFLDKYLESLDPARMFFYEKEIQSKG